MRKKKYHEATQTGLSFIQNRLAEVANTFESTDTKEMIKTLKEPVGPWAKFQDKSGRPDAEPVVFNFLSLGKKLRTSDLDKLYWVKFLQKKFPNLGKRGSKDDIEKELLKEFGGDTSTMSPGGSKEDLKLDESMGNM